MTLQLIRAADELRGFAPPLVILVAALAIMGLLTLVFGVHLPVADYRIAPDPAGNLPF
jgi:hypothetical protein